MPAAHDVPAQRALDRGADAAQRDIERLGTPTRATLDIRGDDVPGYGPAAPMLTIREDLE